MKGFKLEVVGYISILLVVVNLNLNGAKEFNDIDCEIKKRISGSSLKLSSAAIDQAAKHLKDDAHKKNSFQLFHCRCIYENDEWQRGELGDNDAGDLDDDFVDDDDDKWGDWRKSEIFKISDCDELDLNLAVDKGIQEELPQSILIVENIKQLSLEWDSEEADKRFSSIYFRNVSFLEETNKAIQFDADDVTDMVFDSINVPKLKSFKIVATNKNNDPKGGADKYLSHNPMITITNSTFGSPYELGNNGDFEAQELKEFRIQVANIQRDKACEDDDKCDGGDCYFNYMGEVRITHNRFRYLDKEAITIINGKTLDFVGNTVEVNMDDAIIIANIKNLNLARNRFEFVGKEPTLKIGYKYSATEVDKFGYFPDDAPSSWNKIQDFEDDCGDEDDAKFASMAAGKIGKIEIMKNWFNRLSEDTIKFVIDKKYKKEFAMNKFMPKETSNRQRCECPIPTYNKDDEPDDDDEEVNNIKLTREALKMQQCLSPQTPEVLGTRMEICTGKYPKPQDDLLKRALEGGIKAWHLILAMIICIILTAVIVVVIVKYCCMSDENKSRTVSPA